MCSTAVAETLVRVPMSEVIPKIDEFVASQYWGMDDTLQDRFSIGHNRATAFAEVMELVRHIHANDLKKMSPQSGRAFMRLLRARELRLLNKAGARIDLDDFDPHLSGEWK